MKKITIFLLLILFLLPNSMVYAKSISERLSGRILIQAESHGEAWYVNPADLERYFLGRPQDAFNVMKTAGIGAKNFDLAKIPLATGNMFGIDSDNDGLSDVFEEAIGTNINKADTDGDGNFDKLEIEKDYNPNDIGLQKTDLAFVEKNKGKIFIQIENRGQAWYVNPTDGQRYFLGRPDDAFSLMRILGLGITNIDLASINIGYLEIVQKISQPMATSTSENVQYNLATMEIEIHNLINIEREKAGLAKLKWNGELAAVAREHSTDLAKEDESLTNFNLTCDYPMIHHEGLVFGLYHNNRLNNRNIYYSSQSGENIALIPVAKRWISYYSGEIAMGERLNTCADRQAEYNTSLKERTENQSLTDIEKIKVITDEIIMRQTEIKKEIEVSLERTDWTSQTEAEIKMVEGWMNSPGHRANILKENFDEAGIGLAYVNGYIIGTQVFITRAECGYQAGACCTKVGYYPYCFIPMTCENNLCEINK